MKKKIIISILIVTIIIIFLWGSGIIPKQIGRIYGTYKMNKEFPKWQLEYENITWVKYFGDYSISFIDKNGNKRTCLIGPKYFPISLGQGMFGLREEYEEEFSTTENNYIEKESIPYDEFLTLNNKYPHNTNSFTQGLFFYNEKMYETIGLYAESKLYKNIDLKTGEYESKYEFDNNIFAEGSVVFNEKLYVLTWKENSVFVFNPETLELENTYYYNRLGWGLTTDNEHLIASDGSSKIYFLNEELKDVKTINVNINGNEIENINELEYINGDIWANVWLSNQILIINKENGEVKEIIDFTELYNATTNNKDNVLNGIAFNEKTNKIYITGKRWDTLYEFELKQN